MHEVGIIQNTLLMAEEQAREAGAVRINEVRMRIGHLSGVVRDALEFAFDVVSRNTMAEGARLSIEEVPAVCWCDVCKEEFEAVELLYECPYCGTLSSELRRGREVELESMEIE